ncbi:uncharacterized protein EDB91DRAFT_1086206 [Suillus paluster]|uniref:uncharacterized protein n=1 Tax=Suillus paluster TaxID=48578 RepID=UPI001B85E0A5|nr:uncharacterized protein EDB91DRAFT_1086206 [Suillus paluster]KAG1728038.1 hypothetical protein EDB91DRAFT_1086206 [Suillus paluster]
MLAASKQWSAASKERLAATKQWSTASKERSAATKQWSATSKEMSQLQVRKGWLQVNNVHTSGHTTIINMPSNSLPPSSHQPLSQQLKMPTCLNCSAKFEVIQDYRNYSKQCLKEIETFIHKLTNQKSLKKNDQGNFQCYCSDAGCPDKKKVYKTIENLKRHLKKVKSCWIGLSKQTSIFQEDQPMDIDQDLGVQSQVEEVQSGSGEISGRPSISQPGQQPDHQPDHQDGLLHHPYLESIGMVVDADLQVLCCLVCQIALPPDHITGHIDNVHPGLQVDDERYSRAISEMEIAMTLPNAIAGGRYSKAYMGLQVYDEETKILSASTFDGDDEAALDSLLPCTMSMPQVWWTDRKKWEEMLYKGNKVHIDHLRQMFALMESKQVDLWENKVLVGISMCVCYKDIKDNNTNHDVSYSFLSDHRNGSFADRDRFFKAIIENRETLGWFTIIRDGEVREVIWDKGVLMTWLRDYAEFQKLVLARCEILSGAPGCGTKLTAMVYRNTKTRS